MAETKEIDAAVLEAAMPGSEFFRLHYHGSENVDFNDIQTPGIHLFGFLAEARPNQPMAGSCMLMAIGYGKDEQIRLQVCIQHGNQDIFVRNWGGSKWTAWRVHKAESLGGGNSLSINELFQLAEKGGVE